MSQLDVRELQKKIIILQSKIRKKDEKINKLENQIEEIYKKIKSQKDVGNSEQDISEIKEERDQYRKQNIELRQKIENLQESLENVKNQLKEARTIEKPTLSPPTISYVSAPTSQGKERDVVLLREQLRKKEMALQEVRNELDALVSQGSGGTSYTQMRKLNMEMGSLSNIRV